MNNKNFKKQEATKLARLFDEGYLKETETGYQVLERRGKKFTRVEMTFRIDIKGVNLPDEYQQGVSMKLKLNKEEKAALLVAVSKGELDTAKIPRLYKEIRGNNDFMDLLMQLDADEEDNIDK